MGRIKINKEKANAITLSFASLHGSHAIKGYSFNRAEGKLILNSIKRRIKQTDNMIKIYQEIKRQLNGCIMSLPCRIRRTRKRNVLRSK